MGKVFCMSEKKIEIVIASDEMHEKVFAEMYYRGKYLGLVSQEKGPKHLRIELPGGLAPEEAVLRNVRLLVFIRAVKMAKEKLLANES